MKISKPFGTWSSDITAKTASKALIEMSDIQSFDGNLYWIEYRPEENGRSVIVTMDKFGAINDMFTSPFSQGLWLLHIYNACPNITSPEDCVGYWSYCSNLSFKFTSRLQTSSHKLQSSGAKLIQNTEL